MSQNDHKTTHGKSKTPTYRVWADMKTRCSNAKRHQFQFYGGRGISVCDRWNSSFEAFLSDMGEKPAGMSLDRIDNSLGYSKENCRWATQKEQCNNRRSCVKISFNGRTMTIAEWSLELGSHRGLVHDRIQAGWGEISAITTPVKK